MEIEYTNEKINKLVFELYGLGGGRLRRARVLKINHILTNDSNIKVIINFTKIKRGVLRIYINRP